MKELADGEETTEIEAVVIALAPAYHQVKVRTSTGQLYAITRQTAGIDISALKMGQKLKCTVTVKLPRVLRARANDF